jgi:hypothetical protein
VLRKTSSETKSRSGNIEHSVTCNPNAFTSRSSVFRAVAQTIDSNETAAEALEFNENAFDEDVHALPPFNDGGDSK